MHLIQDHKRVLFQEVSVVGDALQKDAIGHEYDSATAAELGFLADLVPHDALVGRQLGLDGEFQ